MKAILGIQGGKLLVILSWYFFEQLFRTSNPSIPLDLVDLISPVISPTDFATLDTIPTANEIFLVLKSIGSLKALGADGLSVLFYQEYWHIFNSDIDATV